MLLYRGFFDKSQSISGRHELEEKADVQVYGKRGFAPEVFMEQ